MIFSIANDFSKFPSGKTKADGQHSGEHLREKLVILVKQYQDVLIDFNGTMGYGSSFLESAFTGFFNDIPEGHNVKYSCEDESIVDEVKAYAFAVAHYHTKQKIKEYKTTYSEFQSNQNMPDPYIPDGSGWSMCGSSASNWHLFWFWVREVEVDDLIV